MSKFYRRGVSYSLELTLDEAHILINLVEQLLELLGDGNFHHHYDESDPFAQLMSQLKGATDEIAPPEDPVLLRLLPNAYEDPGQAADFRRFTEQSLRASKQHTLTSMRESIANFIDPIDAGSLDRPHIPNDESGHELYQLHDIDESAWLTGLNDLRIALSVRLDIDADSYELFESMSDADPQKSLYAVYFWLGWLQESLLELLVLSSEE